MTSPACSMSNVLINSAVTVGDRPATILMLMRVTRSGSSPNALQNALLILLISLMDQPRLFSHLDDQLAKVLRSLRGRRCSRKTGRAALLQQVLALLCEQSRQARKLPSARCRQANLM